MALRCLLGNHDWQGPYTNYRFSVFHFQVCARCRLIRAWEMPGALPSKPRKKRW